MRMISLYLGVYYEIKKLKEIMEKRKKELKTHLKNFESSIKNAL